MVSFSDAQKFKKAFDIAKEGLKAAEGKWYNHLKHVNTM